jgi:hypothetical protein
MLCWYAVAFHQDDGVTLIIAGMVGLKLASPQ